MAHSDASVDENAIPLFTAVTTFFGYGLLIFFGRLRDLLGCRRQSKSKFAPLTHDWEDFYTRRLYHRIQDCWNRPIASCPGAWIDLMERIKPGHLGSAKPPVLTGKTRRVFNIGSYNYLGFGDPDSPTKTEVFKAIEKYSVGTCGTRSGLGTTPLHIELEKLVARFVGKEDAMVFGMGFGTNGGGIPALVGKGGLIVSDASNHASIVIGARSSGATIKVFKHNNAADLEAVIRRAIVEGQPRTHRPYTKILIMIEGIYSMEGEMPPLAEIVAIKKKYNCYLYVDEAHSIGALGRGGRGICEEKGVDPRDVDILMGTFTKSFGSVGGYIAADKALLDVMRQTSSGFLYSSSMSPPACQQAISAFKIILGEDGTTLGAKKLRALRENSNYMRKRLKEIGAHVLGDWGSPVAPVLVYNPAKMPSFSRCMLDHNIAVVVVGYPATPLLSGRSRLCISAAHSVEDLEMCVQALDSIMDEVGVRFMKPALCPVPADVELPPPPKNYPGDHTTYNLRIAGSDKPSKLASSASASSGLEVKSPSSNGTETNFDEETPKGTSTARARKSKKDSGIEPVTPRVTRSRSRGANA